MLLTSLRVNEVKSWSEGEKLPSVFSLQVSRPWSRSTQPRAIEYTALDENS